jgi:hypothetical protein
VICGQAKVCSRDHVPPKCIFPRPRPSDLVTVPACAACNMQRSGLDERFKVFLGLTVGYHLEGDASYRGPIQRTLAHNGRWRSDILTSTQCVLIRDPVNLASQSALAVPLDRTAHDTVVERTVRGLYFHHKGKILGKQYPLRVKWLRVLDDELFRASIGWNTGTLGDTALVCKYSTSVDDPNMTAWVLQWFQKTWSVVLSNPDVVDADSTQ